MNSQLVAYKDRLFNIPVSDTQAYKQFGNAVVTPVIEAIAKEMKSYIMENIKGNKRSKRNA